LTCVKRSDLSAMHVFIVCSAQTEFDLITEVEVKIYS